MCISDAKLSEAILDFFIVVFSGLQHHMGPTFTEHIVQTILDSFTRYFIQIFFYILLYTNIHMENIF